MILERKSLIELLPAIHRLRDREAGEPLLRLLSVIAEQIEVLQESIDQLYDDQFIETCAEWVVPYIGDLVGTRGVRDIGATGFSARAYVANTIAYRRRKGTAAMLEQLARDLTGWNGAVVEYFLRLAWTQNVNHVRRDAKVWLDLRDAVEMERLNTPFAHAMRTVDVRRISNGRGKHNIPNIGIFLWRLQAYSLTNSPAVRVDAERWMFSPLGNDTPLFSLPVTETEIAHLAERENVPMPITRRALARDTALWYGNGASIEVRLGGVPVAVVNAESCDLADAGMTWEHTPAPAGMLAIDPVLGRLVLHDDPANVVATIGANPATAAARVDANRYMIPPPGPDSVSLTIGGVPVDPARIRVTDLTDLWNPPQPQPDTVLVDEDDGRVLFPADPEIPAVTYHYGAVADIGGGEYEREPSFLSPGTTRIRVPHDEVSIANAIAALGTSSGVIEISDSGRYEGAFSFNLAASQHVELRGENNARPAVIVNAAITIAGATGSELTINGLLIAGGAVTVSAGTDLDALRIRHCTLVPGETLQRDGTPNAPIAASLIVAATKQELHVDIDSSILGPIDMNAQAGPLAVRDSIIDSPGRVVPAIDGQGGGAGPATTLGRCTIFGTVNVQELTLASECIFTDVITVERKQSGCVRFSFVLRPSRTPRRYRCQPELAAREAVEARKRELAPAKITDPEITAITDLVHATMRPAFVSTRYGNPAYAQLAAAVHRAITNGAADGSEMGVYRNVEAARREANLRAALDEYLRFGLEAGIFYAS